VLVQQDELAYTSVPGIASLAVLFKPPAKKDDGLWCISIAPIPVAEIPHICSLLLEICVQANMG